MVYKSVRIKDFFSWFMNLLESKTFMVYESVRIKDFHGL